MALIAEEQLHARPIDRAIGALQRCQPLIQRARRGSAGERDAKDTSTGNGLGRALGEEVRPLLG
jgi:hypothetical protein